MITKSEIANLNDLSNDTGKLKNVILVLIDEINVLRKLLKKKPLTDAEIIKGINKKDK